MQPSSPNAGTPPASVSQQQPSGGPWRRSPAEWFAIVVGALLALRGVSTLVVGASFATPGDGWRAIYQLAISAILLLSLRGSRSSVASVVLFVGLLYALATVLGLINGHSILGVAPVSTRDKVVHPLLAVVGIAIGLRETRPTSGRPRAPAPSH
jgi:hypothetical protein